MKKLILGLSFLVVVPCNKICRPEDSDLIFRMGIPVGEPGGLRVML